MRAVDEGLAPETVGQAMTDFGMPMGPIELADLVGLDIALAAGRQLAETGAAPPRCLLERCERGQFGKKSGRGFYEYPQGAGGQGAVGSGAAEVAGVCSRPWWRGHVDCSPKVSSPMPTSPTLG